MGIYNGVDIIENENLVFEKYCQINFPKRKSNRRIMKKWRKNKNNWGMQKYEKAFMMSGKLYAGPKTVAALIKMADHRTHRRPITKQQAGLKRIFKKQKERLLFREIDQEFKEIILSSM